MAKQIIGDQLEEVKVYDIRKIPEESVKDEKIHVCDSWEDVYFNSDIVVTCTVSDKPYINKKPNEGTLLLNVSLRDYTNDVYEYVKHTIIVDDWEEVCREDTDIERLHLDMGLTQDMVYNITEAY